MRNSTQEQFILWLIYWTFLRKYLKEQKKCNKNQWSTIELPSFPIDLTRNKEKLFPVWKENVFFTLGWIEKTKRIFFRLSIIIYEMEFPFSFKYIINLKIFSQSILTCVKGWAQFYSCMPIEVSFSVKKDGLSCTWKNLSTEFSTLLDFFLSNQKIYSINEFWDYEFFMLFLLILSAPSAMLCRIIDGNINHRSKEFLRWYKRGGVAKACCYVAHPQIFGISSTYIKSI